MRISILSNTHYYNDDRLFYHFAKTLAKENHIIKIITCEIDLELELENNISVSSFNSLNYTIKEKINIYKNKISSFNPDILICSDPITILAAKKFNENKNSIIIYDITEWYPSKGLIKKHIFGTKIIFSLIYFSLFLYSSSLVDGFIFGEYYKSLLPKKLFFKKKNINISYYPSIDYITALPPNLKENILRLCYGGNLSIEKGVINFLNVIKNLIKQNNELKIYVKFIGEFNTVDKEKCLNLIESIPDNVQFTFHEFQELTKYIELINDTDIFLDLRANDIVNSHCLPIKLFYYMALQRPVIYSNIKAIKKEIEIEQFGYLVNPGDFKEISRLILNYQRNPYLFKNHCLRARELYETKYNWSTIETPFINFIENFNTKNN